MPDKFDRRAFLRGILTASAAGLAASACGGRPTPVAPAILSPTEVPAAPAIVRPLAPATGIPPTSAPAVLPTTVAPAVAATLPPAGAAYLAVARGPGADPAELVRRGLAAVGGIERFLKPGADVIVKPNICNAYHGPEYASTTNPDVVGALVALCLGAGARRVRVMDYPFGGSPQAAYETSGIAAAVKAAGGQMEAMNRLRFRPTPLPGGRALREMAVYGDILDADLVINVPIAKNHGGARLTLALKNLLGVVQDRGAFHARGLHQTIADLSTAVRPQLTVIDAVRILTANGPTGGNLDDVKRLDTVIVSADPVAADAYAAGLFGMKPEAVDHIRLAAEMGLGRIDLDALKIEEIGV